MSTVAEPGLARKPQDHGGAHGAAIILMARTAPSEAT